MSRIAIVLVIAAIASLVVVLFMWACAVVSTPTHEEDYPDDQEAPMPVPRARGREGDAGRPAGGAVPPVSARQPGPRDPVIGLDQARAEVRERIRRYNQREVRR